MKDIKKQVEFILSSYSRMQKELLVLEFELNRITPALRPEAIEEAVLARPGFEVTSGSHISDRTANIVVEHIDSQRGGKYHALTALIHNIRFELHRMEYYLSLLPEDEAAAVKWFYFDGLSWAEITKASGCSQSTMQRRKKRGVDKLIYYYSVLDNLKPDGADIQTWMRFIGYIHEERFTQCLKLAGKTGNAGIEAMLYIISGCNELWQAGAESFLDFSTGETKSYAESVKPLSDGGAKLLRLAYHLAHGLDRDYLVSVLSRYFPGLEYVHLELAIEAVKLAMFSAGRRMTRN